MTNPLEGITLQHRVSHLIDRMALDLLERTGGDYHSAVAVDELSQRLHPMVGDLVEELCWDGHRGTPEGHDAGRAGDGDAPEYSPRDVAGDLSPNSGPGKARRPSEDF